MTLQISPLQIKDIPSAVSLFIQEVRELNARLPEVPDFKLDKQVLSSELRALILSSKALAAISDDGIVGYLGWNVYDNFRGVSRRTTYSPDYAHAAPGLEKHKIYQALYNAASKDWYSTACKAFVLTLLANHGHSEAFWFWNGYGLLVVDAIRSSSLALPHIPADFLIRKATQPDLESIVQLDQEHYRHYPQPPTLMVPRSPRSTSQLAGIINSEKSSIWIAKDSGILVGFMSFEMMSEGATMLVTSEANIAITSAYVQPQFRGINVGAGILGSALREYSQRGFQTCSVDFESVNPFAANFWMKFFKPVCLSVMRVPENNLSP